MNIKKAKEEIRDTIEAYLLKNPRGEYVIPAMRQRPVLLMGPPGIGKTQIMEQIAMECGIGLVAYTITHHTRQSAIGLPFIQERNYGGNVRHVTEYTMSEIVASVYDRMEETGLSEGILSSMKSTVYRRLWPRPCCSSFSIRHSGTTGFLMDGSLFQREIRRSTINPSESLTWQRWTGSNAWMWNRISRYGKSMQNRRTSILP